MTVAAALKKKGAVLLQAGRISPNRSRFPGRGFGNSGVTFFPLNSGIATLSAAVTRWHVDRVPSGEEKQIWVQTAEMLESCFD